MKKGKKKIILNHREKKLEQERFRKDLVREKKGHG